VKNRFITMAGVGLLCAILWPSLGQSQDLIDVLSSIDRLNKRIGQLEIAQKDEIEKLQAQIGKNPGSEGYLAGSIDTLRQQVNRLEEITAAFPQFKNSLMELAAKFENVEGQLANLGQAGGPPPAQNTGILLAELKDLTGELKKVIERQPVNPPAPPAPTASASAPSKFDFKLYGFVKLEAIYDNREVVKGDWLLYANRNNTPQAKQEIYTMNARHSRLGLKMAGPKVGENGKVNGLIEVDFSGGFPNSATAARMPNLTLRHAWVELNYPRWEARFGQDWALISGPFPNSTSFVVNGGSGNLWMRIPQISLTYKEKPVKAAVSINRPMAGNSKYHEYEAGDLDPVDDGEKSGLPWMMGRFWVNTKPAVFSISGHYGKEKINDLSGHPHKVKSYSLNGDAVVKFGRFSFTGKGFYGENLNTFLGGIIQGYISDSTSVKNIGSAGGWIQLMYEFSSSWAATTGAGIDDPKDEDLTNNMRTRNEMAFVNVSYKIQKIVEFMLETEYLATHYKNAPMGDNLRLQFATYLRF